MNDHNVHAEESRRLFKAKICDDVGMIEVLQRLALELQGIHYGHLTRVILVACSTRDLDLLDGNHFTGSGIEGEINAAKVAFSDEFATNPLEYGYARRFNKPTLECSERHR